MKSKKDIQNHIDQLMKDAEKPDFLSTSDNFEDNLFARFDEVDKQHIPVTATIFSLSEVRKYAAVILILILNVSAILFYSANSDAEQSAEDISEYSEEYFPDYATLTSLE
ncbi:MAG: hypothetical protein ROO71_11900 [Balneola sp.]